MSAHIRGQNPWREWRMCSVTLINVPVRMQRQEEMAKSTSGWMAVTQRQQHPHSGLQDHHSVFELSEQGGSESSEQQGQVREKHCT